MFKFPVPVPRLSDKLNKRETWDAQTATFRLSCSDSIFFPFSFCFLSHPGNRENPFILSLPASPRERKKKLVIVSNLLGKINKSPETLAGTGFLPRLFCRLKRSKEIKRSDVLAVIELVNPLSLLTVTSLTFFSSFSSSFDKAITTI